MNDQTQPSVAVVCNQYVNTGYVVHYKYRYVKTVTMFPSFRSVNVGNAVLWVFVVVVFELIIVPRTAANQYIHTL